MTGIVRRATVPNAVGQNRQRIQNLEMVAPLRYGDNEGDWLDVIANGQPTGDSLHGYNLFLHTTDDTYGDLPGPGTVDTDGGSIVIAAGKLTAPRNPSFVALYGTDDDGATGGLFVGHIGLAQPVSPFNFYEIKGVGVALGLSDPTKNQRFSVSGREVLHVLQINDNYTVDWLVNQFDVTLANTATLIVKDTGGNPIFKINQNGALQGKTGQTLTFNL